MSFSQKLEPSIVGHTVAEKLTSEGNQLWEFKEDAVETEGGLNLESIVMKPLPGTGDLTPLVENATFIIQQENGKI